MRTLKTSEAAELLNVSANTLRAWEQRFGYPRPQRSPGGHRLYPYGEIDALRRALHDGLSAASATSKAQEMLSSDVRALVSALLSFSRSSADAVMEASLALKPIERAIEDLLLAALDELLRRRGRSSVAWAFASSWGCDWLRRTQRVVGVPECSLTVLIVDGARLTDPAAPHIRALEFFCAQRGAEVLSVTAQAMVGLSEAITSVCPHALVVAGNEGDRDMIARWVYAVRSSIGPRPFAGYRRANSALRGVIGFQLDDCASRAQRELFGLVRPGTEPELRDDRNGAAAVQNGVPSSYRSSRAAGNGRAGAR
jgi:DNA-binding transcriptional MerR regulator